VRKLQRPITCDCEARFADGTSTAMGRLFASGEPASRKVSASRHASIANNRPRPDFEGSITFFCRPDMRSLLFLLAASLPALAAATEPAPAAVVTLLPAQQVA